MAIIIVLYLLLFMTHYQAINLMLSKISPTELYSSDGVVLVSIIGLSMLILLSIMSLEFLHNKLAKLVPARLFPEWFYSHHKSNILVNFSITILFVALALFFNA